MAEEMTLFAKLQAACPKLPAKKRRLCQFILEQPLAAGNMTMAVLSKQAGVGPATIVRFVTEDLGFESFSLFKQELRNACIHSNTAALYSFPPYFNNRSAPQSPDDSYALDLINNASELFQNMTSSNMLDKISKAADYLLTAKHIYVIGSRSSAPIALCFENCIDPYTKNIVQLSMMQDYVFDRAFEISAGDVMVAFSGWPCTKRTIDVCKFALERDIPLILITNCTEHVFASRAAVVINTNTIGVPYIYLPNILVVEQLAAEVRHRSLIQGEYHNTQLYEFTKENQIDIWMQKP